MQSYDVVVVGVGPVGAVLVHRLRAAGTSVLAVERSAGVHPLPRAVAADDEVQELLARVAPDALDGAVLDVPVRFLGARGQSLGALRFPPGVGGRPGLALFHQPIVEARLRSGLEVLSGVALTGLAQDALGVTVQLDDGSTVRASWVVGCDGASSAVRRAAGIGWGGRELRRWLVVDVSGDVPAEGFTYRCDPARPSVDMPLPGGHRWEWLLEDDEASFDPRPLLPDGVEVVRCVEYRYGARRAATWRSGRVLLAGDAAHTMPPFAGQGLGAGVRDAWALGALLPAGRVAEYEPLRAPHVAAMTRLSLLLGRVLETRSAAAAIPRDALLALAFRSAWMQRGGPRQTRSGVLDL